ncbi:MAG TPA: cytochrome C oxidase subunit IV family protein [Candidatus Binatia bacterium]|jgi:cytochrome c oxidase subunit 4|nr:cytochrome C oxidase subunit IV family protein [Candidatus Binatia bacterium]
MAEQIIPPKTYLLVFAALLVLTYTTYIVAFIDLGPWNIVVAMAIAMGKAFLVTLFFMHLRHSPKLTWIVAGGGLFWLGILLALTVSDYLTRGWLAGVAGKS